jgi:hypothetical protein
MGLIRASFQRLSGRRRGRKRSGLGAQPEIPSFGPADEEFCSGHGEHSFTIFMYSQRTEFADVQVASRLSKLPDDYRQLREERLSGETKRIRSRCSEDPLERAPLNLHTFSGFGDFRRQR